MAKEKTAFFLEVVPPDDRVDFLMSVRKKINSSRRAKPNDFELRPHLTIAYPFVCSEVVFRDNLDRLLAETDPFKINLDKVDTLFNLKYNSGIIFLTTKKPQEIEKLEILHSGLLGRINSSSRDSRNRTYLPHITLEKVTNCGSVSELERQRDFFARDIGKVSFEVSEINVRKLNEGIWEDIGIFTIGSEAPKNGSRLSQVSQLAAGEYQFHESDRASIQ